MPVKADVKNLVNIFLYRALNRFFISKLIKNFFKNLDIYSKKVKLLIINFIEMIEFKRSKKSRSKNALFNPYKNGISAYDMTYLSSKKVLKNKTLNLKDDFQKDNLAA